MDHQEIEKYLNQLKSIEKELSDESVTENTSFIGDLDGLLSQLGGHIEKSITTTVDPLEVRVKRLDDNSVIPSYSKVGDAGMDLTVTKIINETEHDITYGFGLSFEIPPGYVGLVFPRSSVRNYNLLLTNSVGVIDSGYRGEIQATFKKVEGVEKRTRAELEEKHFYHYRVGERAAQILILPYPNVIIKETDTLSDTDRGDGGFGSTGT